MLLIIVHCDLPLHGVIEIVNPDQKTRWEIGLEGGAEMDWNSQNLAGDIRISLLKDHEWIMLITDTVDASRERYVWTVPGSVQPDQGYSIFMESPTDSMAWVESKSFRIEPYATDAILDIIRPRQNDSWEIGLDQGAEIIWDSEGLNGMVMIELLRGTDRQMTIADSIPASLELLNWTVPSSVDPDENYQVCISSHEDKYLSTFSKQFTITTEPMDYELNITQPASNTRWMQEETNGAVIEWESDRVEGTMRIELMRGDSLILRVADSVAVTDSRYIWTVPAQVVPDNDYSILISSNEMVGVSELSRRFRIEEYDDTPLVELTAPTRDHTWHHGVEGDAVISWAHRNVSGYLKIDLYERNSFYGVITQAVAIDSSGFIWTVPDTIPRGKGYKVYIESLADPELNDMSAAFDILPLAEDQEIEILAPVQGDEWIITAPNAAIIEWKGTYLDSTVRIDLYDNKDFLFTIADGIDVLEGEYTWTVPESVSPGKGYKIYVESNLNPDASDMSGRVTISTPQAELELLRPEKGDEWTITELDDAFISWSSVWLDSTIRIHLYNSDGYYMSISEAVDVEDTYLIWTVPDNVVPGNDYKIYIESNRDSTLNDLSGRIRINTPTPALNLISPDQGDNWIIGEEGGAIIQWESSWIEGDVRIDLFNKKTLITTLSDTTDVGAHVYLWTVPDSIQSGRGYQIQISSIEIPEMVVESGQFQISEPERSLTIHAPVKNDEWFIGDSLGARISWSYVNVDSSLRIELYKQKKFQATIIEEIAVTAEEYLWTVPDSITDGKGYSVHLVSHHYPDVEQESESFTISSP